MHAYRIKDLAKPNGPIARSTLYKHAAEGRLIMRRVGGATVVLAQDWRRYLEGAPATNGVHASHCTTSAAAAA